MSTLMGRYHTINWKIPDIRAKLVVVVVGVYWIRWWWWWWLHCHLTLVWAWPVPSAIAIIPCYIILMWNMVPLSSVLATEQLGSSGTRSPETIGVGVVLWAVKICSRHQKFCQSICRCITFDAKCTTCTVVNMMLYQMLSTFYQD